MPDLLHDRVVAAIGDLYDVDAELGRGGMAIVYRATDVRLRRRVAVKVLPPDLAFRADVRTRFLREAETAAQLNHPDIVPIYSVDERQGIVYFVMGLVNGESVAQRLAREGALPPAEARRILREVADALAYAHARGVVHRDIKPDNILLDSDSGRAMVTDFGIARAAEGGTRLTVTGIAVGTPAYMSPEQATGDHDVDGRSDQYSLGVVGYQMLAGVTPFVASNTPAMLMKHLTEEPRPLRSLRTDVPPALEAALARALAKRPEDRWPDAAAFRDALASDAPPAAPPRAEPERHRTPEDPFAAAREAFQGASRWFGTAAPNAGANGRRDAGQPDAPVAEPPSRRAAEPPNFVPPPYPVWRAGMSREEWREQRRAWHAQVRAQRRAWRHQSGESFALRPLEDRITIFRRNLVGTGATVGFLFVINMVTFPFFPWFIFPAIGMGARLIKQWSSLWSDGVTLRQIFGRRPAPALPSAGAPASRAIGAGVIGPRSEERLAAEAAALAPAEVLAGPHGAAVRRAVADRADVRATLDSLSKPDRELLPNDVSPIADKLVDRVASLAQMLHRLDADASPDALARLETRLADVEREPESSSDRARRLGLLQRQRATMRDLAERRATVASQLESAVLALQNLKLDLIKLRSSGVANAIEDVTSATREARALSRDIGHVLDAAAEVRKL